MVVNTEDEPPLAIAFLGPVPPLRGGIAQHSAQLVTALRTLGHHVDVHSWRAQYPKALYPGDERDPEAVPFGEAHFDLAWYAPWTWWKVGRAAAHGQLLAFPWVTPVQAPVYAVAMAAARRTRRVSIVHNPLPHEARFFDRWLTRLVLGRLDGAIVHADELADQLAADYPDLEVRVVGHPPNLSMARTPLPTAPPYRFLFTGMIRPYKGVDVAVDALRIARAGGVDARLTVAGEFWTPVDELRAQVRRAGLDEHVDIRPGYVPDADLATLLAEHHAVVAPYRSATQSGIVPLAFASGRPVIATDVGGIGDVVSSGLNGLLCRPDDPEAFARLMSEAIGDLHRLARGAADSRVDSWRDVAESLLAGMAS